MATCTAQITIGGFPGGWGGENAGIGPGWVMYLVEGGRAAWVLERVVHNSEDEGTTDPVTWIPYGPDRLLADALVMIAALVEKDAETRELIERRLSASMAGDLLESPSADLTELDGDVLQEIEAGAAEAVVAKLVVTVMNGSSITGQLALLERCSMIAEVCTACWIRQPDADGKLRTAGTLPPENPEGHRFGAIRLS